LKIGNLSAFNPVMGKLTKHFSVGGSPEYWSPEQGGIYDKIREYSQNGNYATSMKLLPSITYHTDLYQLGLLIYELLFSERYWQRGDRVNILQIR
jgi:serine/threonine protein kinase